VKTNEACLAVVALRAVVAVLDFPVEPTACHVHPNLAGTLQCSEELVLTQGSNLFLTQVVNDCGGD